MEASDRTLAQEPFDPLAKALLQTIQRLGFGTIIIDAHRNVIDINTVACDLLERHLGLRSGRADAGWIREAVRRLTEKAAGHPSKDAEAWVKISGEGDRPLAVHLIPLASGNPASGCSVMIIVDFDRPSQPNQSTLSRLFGLTAAEARVASQVARGGTTVDMASCSRLSVATIRSQMASIFQKTNTRRQSELALLLTRAAVLP